MLKLMKHEILKDKMLYIMVLGAMLVVELYFIISCVADSKANLTISATLLIIGGMGGVFFLLILGIISYTRELGAKYSYMTFMTPNSTYKIMGAKYLTLFGITMVLSCLYVALVGIDMCIIYAKNSKLEAFFGIVRTGSEYLGMDIKRWLAEMGSTLVLVWIEMFLIIGCAYLAVTISRTVLAGKKGSGFLSFVLFAVIIILVNVIESYIPQTRNIYSFGDMLIADIPKYIFNILVITGTYLTVSYMLKKKISL